MNSFCNFILFFVSIIIIEHSFHLAPQKKPRVTKLHQIDLDHKLHLILFNPFKKTMFITFGNLAYFGGPCLIPSPSKKIKFPPSSCHPRKKAFGKGKRKPFDLLQCRRLRSFDCPYSHEYTLIYVLLSVM
jgi:hypothetical protein